MKRFNLDNGGYVKISDNGVIWFFNKAKYFHRVDGPAIIYPDGHQEWWLNGYFHRKDGPAIVRANRSKVWFLHGKKMSETEHARAVTKMKEDSNSSRSDHSGRTVIIDGKEYRLTLVDSE